jgi:hypothetical protein
LQLNRILKQQIHCHKMIQWPLCCQFGPPAGLPQVATLAAVYGVREFYLHDRKNIASEGLCHRFERYR